MIEFTGYITGNAKKYFWSKERKFVRNILAISLALLFLVVLLIVVTAKYYQLLIAYGVYFLICNLLIILPKKRERERTPYS